MSKCLCYIFGLHQQHTSSDTLLENLTKLACKEDLNSVQLSINQGPYLTRPKIGNFRTELKMH